MLHGSTIICFLVKRENDPILEIAHSQIFISGQSLMPVIVLSKRFNIKKNHSKVAFVINTGDAVDNPDGKMHLDSLWSLWQSGVKKFAPLQLFSCIGNHDPFWKNQDKDSTYYGKPYVLKQLGISNRYYSFVKANWLFIALDGNNSDGIDKTQKEWLTTLLNQNKSKLNVLLFVHEPIVSPGAAYDGGYLNNWKSMVDTLANYKEVKCVLSGHTHIYDEAFLKGIRYYNGGSVSGYWWRKVRRGMAPTAGQKPDMEF